MSISANYSQPVVVNGYVCWNCHQVSEAQKDINPASGTPATGGSSAAGASPAVVFGGALANTAATGQPSTAQPQAAAAVDLYA